jgi:hypothetical protein
MRNFLFRSIVVAIAIATAAACGGDDAPAKKTRGQAPPPPSATPAGTKRGGKDAPQPLVTKSKVAAEFRREFRSEDFAADGTGEINRDPFYSYLVTPPPTTAANPNAPSMPVKDDCENRMVAGKSAFRDMKLVGIILRGTRNFAMFTDASKVGWTVFLGDCLSKDKARVVEITQGCVKLEVRGEAPPGAAAPPPREELSCLHPDDIAVQ